MLYDKAITLYNKIYNDEEGYDTYQRTIIKNVHFEEGQRANIIKSGMENADKVYVSIRKTSIADRQYVTAKEFEKLEDKSRYYTFRKGDRFVKGAINYDIATEKELDENYEAYTITTIDIYDNLSDYINHIEIGGA